MQGRQACGRGGAYQVQVVKLLPIGVGLGCVWWYLLPIDKLLLLLDNIAHNLWVPIAQPAVEGWHSHAGLLLRGAAGAALLLPALWQQEEGDSPHLAVYTRQQRHQYVL
jgi:hypothetical protein